MSRLLVWNRRVERMSEGLLKAHKSFGLGTTRAKATGMFHEKMAAIVMLRCQLPDNPWEI